MQKNILKVKDLCKQFGKTAIINGVSFNVRQGERHAIIGPNGAGKTTLFNLITGKYKVDSGKVFFDEQDITNVTPYKINRLGLARSFQITNIFPNLSALENIQAAILSKQGIRFNILINVDKMDYIKQKAIKILERVGLENKKDDLSGKLAYGDQRSLEMAIVLASDPKMVMLDEPTSGMSIAETKAITKLIYEVTKSSTMLIIEHDMDVVLELADIITVLNYGEIIASGTPDEICNNRKVKKAYLGDYDDSARTSRN